MGATQSDIASTSSLSSQISALEAHLTSLSEAHRDHDVYPSTGPHLTIAGARLTPRPNVTVLTGPIIGKVTSTTAIVLLEVSAMTEVTMHVSLLDLDVPHGRVVSTQTKLMPSSRPASFQATNLLPGERYVVTFSGVSRSCASSRIGSFTTPTPNQALRLLAVSSDKPSSVLSGSSNPWETLSERVQRQDLPSVSCLLHLGGQVSLKREFSDCWVILKRNSERTDLGEGEWGLVEEEVLERLRSAYRFAWNLPYTREVLASVSNLMLAADPDVMENFTLDPDLSPEVGGRVVTALLRLARRVYREYQRSLWDIDNLEDLSKNEEDMVERVTAVFQAKRRRLGREEALAKAEKKMIELRERPLVDDDIVEAAEDRVQELRYEVTEAKSAEAVAASDIPEVDNKESSFHRYGDIGILCVDSLWTRVAADGSQTPDAPLIPQAHLAEFESQIESNAPPRALVVLTSRPLVEMDRDQTVIVRCGGEHNLTDFSPVRSDFALNPDVQEKLLKIVFDWKRRERHRQVLLMTGGLNHGMDTVIKLRNTDWAIRQICTGPVTDHPAEVRTPATGAILNGVYEYEHKMLANQRNYAEALVYAAYGETSAVQARLVGQYFARVGCVLGPVIGRVTNNSAVILVEVNGEAPVTCMVCDVLSGAVLRITKLLKSGFPFAFVFDGLEEDRNYVVRFEGFLNADSRMGSFTTSKDYSEGSAMEEKVSSDYSLNLVFMSGERGGAAGAGMQVLDDKEPENIWGVLSETCNHPWPGVDAIIHLGGQVDMDTAVESALSLLGRAEREGEDSETGKRLVKEALDCLREAYRTSWSLPGTREALASGSHVMIRGALDYGSILLGRAKQNGANVSGKSKRKLRTLVKQVYREYQRQLWDPEGFADSAPLGCSDVEGDGEWAFHRWGPVGVFLMDVKETKLWRGRSGGMESDMPLINENQWRCFSDAMSEDGIGTLIVCCEVPFVDDSIGDARYKATDPAYSRLTEHWPYHGSELLRLLNGLMEWKSMVPGREVLLVCGGISVGVDSILRHEGSGVEIRQIVTGPAASEPQSDLWAERTGVLDDNISYEHGPVTTQHNCMLMRIKGDGVGGTEFQAQVLTAQDMSAEIGSGELKRWPRFLSSLHAFNGADPDEEGGAILMTNGGSEEEIEEQRFRLNLVLLNEVLQREDVRTGLKEAFKAMHAGDSSGYDNPVEFARSCSRFLVRYYYASPAALRDVAIPPNQYMLEVVAKLWEEGKVGNKQKRPSSSGKAKPDEEKKQEGGGGNVPLALMNSEVFVNFCREVFKNALVVRMNLLLKKTSDKMKM